MKCPNCREELAECERYNMFGKQYEYYCNSCETLWNGYLNIGWKVSGS